MSFNRFKNACLKYANEKGFKLFPNNSMYLDNIQNSMTEVFDFSFTSSAIKCYTILKNDDGFIYSDMDFNLAKTFNEFKTILDDLILNYKKMKMENKINAIKNDF